MNAGIILCLSECREYVLYIEWTWHITYLWWYQSSESFSIVSLFCLLQSATSCAHMLFCLYFFHLFILSISQFSAFCLLFVMYSSSLTKNNMNCFFRSQNTIQYYRKQCMQIKYTEWRERENTFFITKRFHLMGLWHSFCLIISVRQRVSR